MPFILNFFFGENSDILVTISTSEYAFLQEAFCLLMEYISVCGICVVGKGDYNFFRMKLIHTLWKEN